MYVGAKGGTPVALLAALARRGTPDIELFYFLLDGISAAELIKRAPQIKHRPLYLGEPLACEAVGDSVSYVPLSLPEACVLVANGRLAFDAAMVATSLSDAQGRVSLGTAVGMTPAVLRRVPLAIAEQVPAMPVTAGDTLWPADAFSAVVVSDRALPEFRHQRDAARSGRIGRYVSRLVEDEATLQVGPGRVPNDALRFLTERRDLRILTDLLSEELSALVEAGAVRADPGGATSPGADPDVMASFLHRNGAALSAPESKPALYLLAHRGRDGRDAPSRAAAHGVDHTDVGDRSDRPGLLRPDRRDTLRRAREPTGIHAGRRAGACGKADPLPLRDR